MRSNFPFVAGGFALVRMAALCLLLASSWVLASSGSQTEPGDTLPTDVRVVIDVSGSMKKNDPANLRQPSLALLLQLLPESSRAGVWTFGEGVNPLVDHADVTADWKRKAIDLSRHIGSADLFTHLGAALDQAAYDRHQPRDRQTHILLLTDGMVDIDKNPQRNSEERQRIVQQLLPQLQEAGYTVHTIALSEHADRELLDQLALATGGVSAVAQSADTLMKAFLRLFDQAAPAEQVPLSDNRFQVDSSIEEFTALVFRRPGSEPTQLIDPDNNAYRYPTSPPVAVEWYRTEQYDLITVPAPKPGEWQIVADMAPESRVTIVSNLKLSVKPLPHQVYAGQTLGLSFRLQEDGGTLTDRKFLDLLEIYGQLVQQGGEQGQELERWHSVLSNGYSRTSGVYQTQVDGLSAEGDYRLTVVVDGKTFQRQFTHYFQARAPLIPASATSSASPTAAEAAPELPAAAEQVEPQPSNPQPSKPTWMLYAILGGGNLLLLSLGLIVYRLLMGKSQPPAASPPEDVAPAVADTDEPILPIELDVQSEGATAEQATSSSAMASDEPILNKQQVDALFAELEGNWNNNVGQNKP